MITSVSLCSGYGGLDLAVEAVFGAVTIAHAEVEPAACKILGARWPGVPNLGDIKTADWSKVRAHIVTAGYPCQPFSLGGRRKGEDDDRHLWPYVCEAVRRIRPRVVVLENVAGHRTLGLNTVLGDLAALGYDASWTSIRASDIGATHQRERLFILATDTRSEVVGLRPGLRASEPAGQRRGRPDNNTASDASDADGPGPQRRESAAGRHMPSRRAAADADGHGWTGWAEATQVGREDGDRPRSDDQRRCDGVPADPYSYALREQPVSESWGDGPSVSRLARPEVAADATSDGWDEGRTEPARIVRGPDVAQRRGATPPDANRDGPAQLGRQQPLKRDADGRSGADIAWGAYEPAIRRWERVLGRVAPSPTEAGPKGGQRLSPRFVEWMMGLDDGWVTAVDGLSRNEMLKALGNGVMPLQAVKAQHRLLWMAGVAA